MVSRWISATADGAANVSAGEYIFATQIDFTGWDLSTVELIARVSVDNRLSAIEISSPDMPLQTRRIELAVEGYQAFASVAVDSKLLFVGRNRLAFRVANFPIGEDGPNPAGLRVEFLFAKPPSRLRAPIWRWAQPDARAVAPPVFSSGGPGTRAGDPDARWRIAEAPSPSLVGLAIVSVVTPGSWLDNAQSQGSKWISPSSDAGAAQPAGNFAYEAVLDLTGWALDQSIELKRTG